MEQKSLNHQKLWSRDFLFIILLSKSSANYTDVGLLLKYGKVNAWRCESQNLCCAGFILLQVDRTFSSALGKMHEKMNGLLLLYLVGMNPVFQNRGWMLQISAVQFIMGWLPLGARNNPLND